MIRVDQNIINAINAHLAETNKSLAKLGEELGVTAASIVKWRRPGSGINPKFWHRLFPLIKDFLPSERIIVANNGDSVYTTLNGKRRDASTRIPLFTVEQLQNFPALISSVEQYAEAVGANRIQYVLRNTDAREVFAFDLPEASGGLPAGARVFVSNASRPVPGRLALGVVAQDNAVILDVMQSDATHVKLGDCAAALTTARHYFSLLCPVIACEIVF